MMWFSWSETCSRNASECKGSGRYCSYCLTSRSRWQRARRARDTNERETHLERRLFIESLRLDRRERSRHRDSRAHLMRAAYKQRVSCESHCVQAMKMIHARHGTRATHVVRTRSAQGLRRQQCSSSSCCKRTHTCTYTDTDRERHTHTYERRRRRLAGRRAFEFLCEAAKVCVVLAGLEKGEGGK